MARKYTEARARATKKYNDKTYHTYLLRLRNVEDAEIISAIEQAKKDGIPIRQWLSSVFHK